MATASQIQCPDCGTNIDVNDILKHQLEDSIRKEYQQKSVEQANILKTQSEALDKAKAEFESKRKQENELFAERLDREKKIAEKSITEAVKVKLEEENKDRLSLMEKELAEKFFSYYGSVFAEGALTAREKSLIALAVSHTVQCPYCIDAYTTDTLEKGCSEAEMMEAVHVAAAIKGGATLVHGVQMMNKAKDISM